MLDRRLKPWAYLDQARLVASSHFGRRRLDFKFLNQSRCPKRITASEEEDRSTTFLIAGSLVLLSCLLLIACPLFLLCQCAVSRRMSKPLRCSELRRPPAASIVRARGLLLVGCSRTVSSWIDLCSEFGGHPQQKYTRSFVCVHGLIALQLHKSLMTDTHTRMLAAGPSTTLGMGGCRWGWAAVVDP